MRTSLNEIREIEDYLTDRKSAGECLLFQAKIIVDPDLENKVALQNRTYRLVHYYGRQQLKKEIEAVHQQLFGKSAGSTFAKRIYSYFSSR